jgi:hypothetical protein
MLGSKKLGKGKFVQVMSIGQVLGFVLCSSKNQVISNILLLKFILAPIEIYRFRTAKC